MKITREISLREALLDTREMARKFSAAMGHSQDDSPNGGDKEIWMALRIWVALSRAHISVVAREQIELTQEGITRGEFGVMDALYFCGTMLISDIQRKILLSSGGVTYLVDRLEKKGYVKRTPLKEDRRAISVSLTSKGEKRFMEIFPNHAHGLMETMEVLSLDEQMMLKDMLKKIGLRAVELVDGKQRTVANNK